jgi:hypothetical protein
MKKLLVSLLLVPMALTALGQKRITSPEALSRVRIAS